MGSQTRRAALFQKGILNFKSQHLSKRRGAGGSPITRPQSRDTGTLRRAPHKCPDPWKGCDGRRRGAPEAHLSPENRGGAGSAGTTAGASCAPRGSGHRGGARAEGHPPLPVPPPAAAVPFRSCLRGDERFR